jgi:hypothetical protein
MDRRYQLKKASPEFDARGRLRLAAFAERLV